MKILLLSTIVIVAVPIAGLIDSSNVDPAHKFGWGENIGWTNWQHDTPISGDGIVVTATHLAGFAWAENVGWINLGDGAGPYANDPADSATFGVNIDFDTGDMFGKAWGENVGWINFDTRATQGPHDQQARLDICENRFRGYVWGENIGWINLNNALHFIALGPDCQPGDVACDGNIALLDYASFLGRLMGPDVSVDCPLFDANGDGDVDLRDFATLQAVFTGF